MGSYILKMNDITKKFPGVRALDRVNFNVGRGEIHCLVGENGAGKSTLMKILSGVYPYGSYEGDIVYDGRVQQFRSIADSERAGIAIIYQELALIPELSVYENIFFGHELMRGRTIDWNRTIIEARKIMKRVGLDINPDTKIKALGVGAQQLVEIAKALSKDVKLLILDEPTSALNEVESENLLRLLMELKSQGVTAIMISHKLKEVIAIADAITVLRDGRTITTISAAAAKPTEQDIIRHMVGREIGNIYPKREISGISEETCFEIRGWSIYDPIAGRQILNDVNITVRKGEIVGIAGLMGAGRTELALSLFGNSPGYKIVGGELILNGKPVRFGTPKEAIRAGLAYLTEDRKKNGLFLGQDIKFNISVTNLEKLTKGLVINEEEEVIVASGYGTAINIKTPSIQQKVGNLSGGNQQKVSLSKWLFAEPQVLILDEPTRGIDVGAKFEIYSLMNKLVEQGAGIIMISSELLEILGMSDRIYVLSEGRISGELRAEDATEENVMEMATGAGEAVL